MAAFLPIVLLSFYSFQLSSDSVRVLVEEENMSAVGNLAELVVQDIQQNVKLAHAIASISGTVSAVRDKNEVALRTRLKAIMVSNPHVHRAFVVDTTGKLWSEFPTAESAYHSDLSDRTWFQSVKNRQRPYISGLYIRPQFPDEPVIAIATPIISKGEFLGVLVFEYRVKHISKWLRNIRLGISGHMLLLDQDGALVAHPDTTVGFSINKQYIGIEEITAAHEGKLHTSEYYDPTIDKEMIATFLPISMGNHMWVAS